MNSPTRSLRTQFAMLSMVATVALCNVADARANPVPDPAGDFLPTYTGPRGLDLDVLSADVTLIGNSTFRFVAQLAGAVGTTPGAFFVWGLDRGQGTERFVAASPSIGAGVFFDSVVIINPSTSNSINLFGLGGTTAPITSPVAITGNTITFDLPTSLFPSTGRALADYGWNFWPRAGAGNALVSDFAPDASTPRVDVVPIAPTSWLFGIGALVAAVSVGRRRAPASKRPALRMQSV